MKSWQTAFTIGLFLQTASLQAAIDTRLEQERMIVESSFVYVASSFAEHDSICCHTHGGKMLWDLSFHSQVVSWDIQGDFLFVFSRSRHEEHVFLTCINKNNGTVLWER